MARCTFKHSEFVIFIGLQDNFPRSCGIGFKPQKKQPYQQKCLFTGKTDKLNHGMPAKTGSKVTDKSVGLPE